MKARWRSLRGVPPLAQLLPSTMARMHIYRRLLSHQTMKGRARILFTKRRCNMTICITVLSRPETVDISQQN